MHDPRPTNPKCSEHPPRRPAMSDDPPLQAEQPRQQEENARPSKLTMATSLFALKLRGLLEQNEQPVDAEASYSAEISKAPRTTRQKLDTILQPVQVSSPLGSKTNGLSDKTLQSSPGQERPEFNLSTTIVKAPKKLSSKSPIRSSTKTLSRTTIKAITKKPSSNFTKEHSTPDDIHSVTTKSRPTTLDMTKKQSSIRLQCPQYPRKDDTAPKGSGVKRVVAMPKQKSKLHRSLVAIKDGQKHIMPPKSLSETTLETIDDYSRDEIAKGLYSRPIDVADLSRNSEDSSRKPCTQCKTTVDGVQHVKDLAGSTQFKSSVDLPASTAFPHPKHVSDEQQNISHLDNAEGTISVVDSRKLNTVSIGSKCSGKIPLSPLKSVRLDTAFIDHNCVINSKIAGKNYIKEQIQSEDIEVDGVKLTAQNLGSMSQRTRGRLMKTLRNLEISASLLNPSADEFKIPGVHITQNEEEQVVSNPALTPVTVANFAESGSTSPILRFEPKHPTFVRERLVIDDPAGHGREVDFFEPWYAQMQLAQFVRNYPLTGTRFKDATKATHLHGQQRKIVSKTNKMVAAAKNVAIGGTALMAGCYATLIQQKLEVKLLEKKEKQIGRQPEIFISHTGYRKSRKNECGFGTADYGWRTFHNGKA